MRITPARLAKAPTRIASWTGTCSVRQTISGTRRDQAFDDASASQRRIEDQRQVADLPGRRDVRKYRHAGGWCPTGHFFLPADDADQPGAMPNHLFALEPRQPVADAADDDFAARIGEDRHA
jgi:hypothetical protein